MITIINLIKFNIKIKQLKSLALSRMNIENAEFQPKRPKGGNADIVKIIHSLIIGISKIQKIPPSTALAISFVNYRKVKGYSILDFLCLIS